MSSPVHSKRQLKTTTVQDGRILSLYVVKENGHETGFYITLGGKRVREFKQRAPAFALYEHLKHTPDLPSSEPRIEDFDAQAQNVERHPATPVSEPRFALLAALEQRACLRRGTTRKVRSQFLGWNPMRLS